MDEFLQALIKFMSVAGIVPPEVTPSDTDREKSYLGSLPTTPDKVVMFKTYYTNIASLTPKNVGVKYIQVISRAASEKVAFDQIQQVYLFLLKRPEFIENISSKYWCIFDVRNGPIPLLADKQGRHIWSLSFPVKTNLY